MWEGRNIIPFLRSNQTPLKWLWNDRNYTARTNHIENTTLNHNWRKYCPLLAHLQQSNFPIECVGCRNNDRLNTIIRMLSTVCKQQQKLRIFCPLGFRFHCCHYRNMTSVFDVSIDCRATMTKIHTFHQWWCFILLPACKKFRI